MSDWQWTVYYDDGITEDNTEVTPPEVAWGGIQAIVQRDHPTSDRIVVTTGDDFYYYDQIHERWFGVELVGLVDYLTERGVLKLGRFIPASSYRAIMTEVDHEVQRREKRG